MPMRPIKGVFVSEESVLDELRRDVRYLKDRVQILDCITRHARGHDRHDAELMTSAFHDDGVDEHGEFINLGPDYAEWANAAHSGGYTLHAHNITNHTCEIDGDVAHCESYVIGAFLHRSRPDRAHFANGRYVDRLERRDGVWRIAVRRTVIDVVLEGDAPWPQSPVGESFLKGSWSTDDISYRRPLQLETPGPRWSDRAAEA